MTDKDVIKALENCKDCSAMEECTECPYVECSTKKGCVVEMLSDALDLINRLKGDAIHYRRKAQNQKQELSRLNAEIEKLTINMNVFGLGMKREKERADTIRADAIKELEVKIHEKLHEAEMHGNFEPVVTREMFDSVVKEMVGEEE